MAKQLSSASWLDTLLWGEMSDIHLSAELLFPQSFPVVEQLSWLSAMLHEEAGNHSEPT